MHDRRRRLVALTLFWLMIVPACDDDDPVGTGELEPPEAPDISRFVGAWVIRNQGDQSTFSCTSVCQDQLDRVVGEFFTLPAADSTCVRIDSLKHLALVEPFASRSAVSDAVVDQGVAFLHSQLATELAGDSLMISFDLNLNLSDNDQRVDAIYTIRAENLQTDDCTSCVGLLGVGGIRRASGACE